MTVSVDNSAASEASSTESNTCCICLEELSETDKKIATTCMHLFHEHCLIEWLNTKNECPLCKTVAPCPQIVVRQDPPISLGQLIRQRDWFLEAGTPSVSPDTERLRARRLRNLNYAFRASWLTMIVGIIGTNSLLPYGIKELLENGGSTSGTVKTTLGSLSAVVALASMVVMFVILQKRSAL